MRTEKLLCGLAAGRWLLSPQWAADSLAAGGWLPEGPYELGHAEEAEDAEAVLERDHHAVAGGGERVARVEGVREGVA